MALLMARHKRWHVLVCSQEEKEISMMERNGIEDLPEEVLEYILSLLSPYRDLKNCMCVCKHWRKCIKDVVRRMQHDFQRAITDMLIDWYELTPEPGPTITKRYSHSACCHGTSMYVFGGCTTTSTTFNDLWRLDLATREWIRPLATGTYPSPKACATMVSYQDNLILFGGWTHPSPYPLHQAWKLFNQLHVFSPLDNRWTLITSAVLPTSRGQPPGMAGHSATVHGDTMVVFGGLQKQSNGRPYASSNDLWVLDLKSMMWRKQEDIEFPPRPRYGQSQVYLDDNHALIIGGCGGPNMVYNDIWLLSMSEDPSISWRWTLLGIRNAENAAPHLWCRPACRVGDKVVILSRSPHLKPSPTSLSGEMLRPAMTRIWVPPRAAEASLSFLDQPKHRSPSPASGTKDNCVNGKRGMFRKPSPLPKLPGESNELNNNTTSTTNTITTTTSSSGNPPSPFYTRPPSESWLSDNDGIMEPIAGPSTSASSSNQWSPSLRDPMCNPPMPLIRPHPSRNRERQLEGLRRMEERIRNLSRRNSSSSSSSSLSPSSPPPLNFPQLPPPGPPTPPPNACGKPTGVRNPMTVYVMDVSQVKTELAVSWLPIKNQSRSRGPEDTSLYTVVVGRGELIMFGGIHKDLGMAAATTCNSNVPESVSNTVHFITTQKWII